MNLDSAEMPQIQLKRPEAAQLLHEQMAAAEELLKAAGQVGDRAEFDMWRRDQKQWIDITKTVLEHIYGGTTEAAAFEEAATHRSYIGGGDWPEWKQDYANDVRNGISKLQGFKSTLRFATEPPSFIERFAGTVALDSVGAATPATAAVVERQQRAVIFLVHGRDEATRDKIHLFLNRAGRHDVVILGEQANRGRTLIEKFEGHAGDASYAVVLLTGDDIGGLKDDDPKNPLVRPRARQNVVFELGFFFGALRREKVAVLYESDVELPTDIDGVAYISLAGNWQKALVTELRAAGLDFSLDRV